MDPALLKEREAFKKRALAQPTVEKRKAKSENEQSKSAKKIKHSHSKPKSSEHKHTPFDYKSVPGSSQYKFSVLAKIVKFMKVRHQQGDLYPLDLEEILDETNQLDIGNSQKQWLSNEALINNPKIDVVEGHKYLFKPKYNIRDRKGLLRLLKNHVGGIMEDDIEESVPNLAKVYKQLGDHILFIQRPNDKKKILFYNDKESQLEIDEEFQKLWRSVTVDGLDEKKIEEYLDKQGITSMQDVGIKKTPMQKRKRGGKKRSTFKTHNEHLADVLQDYSEGLGNKKTG